MLILLVILYKGLFLDSIIDGWKVHPYDESEFQQISALSSISASLTIELVELVFAIRFQAMMVDGSNQILCDVEFEEPKCL